MIAIAIRRTEVLGTESDRMLHHKFRRCNNLAVTPANVPVRYDERMYFGPVNSDRGGCQMFPREAGWR